MGWRHCRYIRKVSLDCADYHPPHRPVKAPTKAGQKSARHPTDPAAKTESLPPLLRPYRDFNVLSMATTTRDGGHRKSVPDSPAGLPSWALSYLLSLAPPSLEAFELHGKIGVDDMILSPVPSPFF